jgi:hypothetical protein
MTRIRSLALLALVGAPLAAQQPAKPDTGMRHRMMGPGMMPRMMQMEQMMAPMMRAMAFTPERLLARKDSLGLTPQQVTRLTTLGAAAAEAKAHMDALAQTFQSASPDTAALRLHFQGAHAAMGKAHWTMLAAAAQAKAVLSDEQRARVERWASAMMMEHH